MTIFVVIILGFAFVFTLLGVLVVAAFEDTKTFKAIDEWIAERIRKDRIGGEEE